MDNKKVMLKNLLLKAWQNRWNDSEWGINIKTVLPRGVSGDVYNLADCILQQAVVGSSANQLALSYLKHSLCAHLISHGAVIKRIAKYDDFRKIYCVTALLDFLNSIINGVTCRGKPSGKSEESNLTNAMTSLVFWLTKILNFLLEKHEANNVLSEEEISMFEKVTEVIEKISKNDFLLGILFIGKHEDPEFYEKIYVNFLHIRKLLKGINFPIKNYQFEMQLNQLANININDLDVTMKLDKRDAETISYCVQPLLSIVLLLNPTSETQIYVSQLLMIQRLKRLTKSRLYFEIINAGLLSLSSTDVSHDAIWSAFTLMKMPHILKQIHNVTSIKEENLDYIPDVTEALDMLLENSVILDFIDSKCEKNFIESMLNEWKKQHIVNEMHNRVFSSKREPVFSNIPKRGTEIIPAQSVINFVPCAEIPLSGILKTLNSDYNKVQEALSGVLCQVLMGNSFDLILSLATVEGRLQTFVSRLIKCNENSKQVINETGKVAFVRQTLFDVSFLMLTFIVQTYGSDIVLFENGESFFEKWVRDCMVERNKMKSPKNMVSMCNETIVDELLLTLSKPDGQLKNCNTTWQDICMNIPGVLYQVLVAWENENLSSADVKRILDNIKRRPFAFSICAANYLCAYMQTVREDEFLKPLNMVQQFLSTHGADDISNAHQEHIKERLGLTFQIIRKMQHDIHPTGNAKIRNLTQNIVSNSPLEEQFRDVWKTIIERGWLSIKSGQILESLLQACGSVWLVGRLVEEILRCKFVKDMNKVMDIVFAVMHLDIERNTIALLDNVIPTLLYNKHLEPQSSTLARLCVYCIISNLEIRNISNSKKRSRQEDPEETSTDSTTSKLRKLNSVDNSGDSCSSDFIGDANSKQDLNNTMKEPLQTSLEKLFKLFYFLITNDELSPKIYFIFQFISLLVECGTDRIKPTTLKLLPQNLVQNLIKVITTDEIKVGFICRLYDLKSIAGRQAAVSDLCLLRNIRMRKQSITL